MPASRFILGFGQNDAAHPCESLPPKEGWQFTVSNYQETESISALIGVKTRMTESHGITWRADSVGHFVPETKNYRENVI
jgi:hypothetical protein